MLTLLPTSAMTMFGLACLCNSFTHALAFSNELYKRFTKANQPISRKQSRKRYCAHGLGDIVNDDSGGSVPVVHRSERVEAFYIPRKKTMAR